MESWIANVVGLMHVNNISQSEVAERLGIRRDYLNKILNGKNTPKDAEERITAAVSVILTERGKTVT